MGWYESLFPKDQVAPGFSEISAAATTIQAINEYITAGPYIIASTELATRFALFEAKRSIKFLFVRTQTIDPVVSQSLDKLIYWLLHQSKLAS